MCTMLRQIAKRDRSWCKNKESIKMLSKELSCFKCCDGTHLRIKTSILNQARICRLHSLVPCLKSVLTKQRQAKRKSHVKCGRSLLTHAGACFSKI